ncbi:hypothetical protein GIB67_003362, partial [Kingdonia uniflora]
MRRFPKKKNTYGLKEIDDALKEAKLERHHGKRYHIDAPVISIVPVIEQPLVGVPVISSSSFATEIKAVVVRVCSQLEEHDTPPLGKYQFSTPEKTTKYKREGEGLEVVKDLMVDDDVEVNLEAISSEYDGGHLKEVQSEGLQPQVVEEEDSEPPTIAVYYNGKKDVQHANEANINQTTVVSVEEQTIESKESKEEVVEGKDDNDGNLQKKPDPVQ